MYLHVVKQPKLMSLALISFLPMKIKHISASNKPIDHCLTISHYIVEKINVHKSKLIVLSPIAVPEYIVPNFLSSQPPIKPFSSNTLSVIYNYTLSKKFLRHLFKFL